jgi:hypothetical protein
VHVYAAAVLALWTVALATGENNAWTVVAFVAALPAAPFVEVTLLLIFAILGFDPTSAAPRWQNAVEAVVVVVGMTAGATADALIFLSIAKAVRLRRSPATPPD